MSKNKNKGDITDPACSYGSGRLVSESLFRNIEGVILTVIETIGLQPSQENAVKSLIRQGLWDRWYDYPYVDEVEATRLWDKHNASIVSMNTSNHSTNLSNDR